MGLDLTTFRHGLSLREFVDRPQVEFQGCACTTRPLHFQLPAVDPARPWRLIIDTALDPPANVGVLDQGPEVKSTTTAWRLDPPLASVRSAGRPGDTWSARLVRLRSRNPCVGSRQRVGRENVQIGRRVTVPRQA